ncbi:MAG: hypothetical protein ACFFD8_03570 [Candidatus Thorarchaeota archaeon]
MSNAIVKELETLEEQILKRLNPKDRSHLSSFLRNVVLFIKRMQNAPLTDEEKLYPPHPMFAHFKHHGGKEAAEILLSRLRFIDNYKLGKSQLILDILEFEYPTTKIPKLSARQAQILHELYENPIIPKYQLAKITESSPRTISNEIKELQKNFGFEVITLVDPGKFNLLDAVILFQSKSYEHSKRLEEFFRTRFGFFRLFQLDRDMQKGAILFRYPNQTEGHKLFEKRVQWLQNEFFTEHQVIQVQGFQYSLSFATYDPEFNAFSLEPGIISEAPFSFVKQHLITLPSPKGFVFEEPITFDRTDFILAHFLYNTGLYGTIKFKQKILSHHGIELSRKTIWKRQKQLREKRVSFPLVDLKIPGFDDQLSFIISCSPEACISIQGILVFLPYIQFFHTDRGCLLNIQRPARTSELTGQLIRLIHREPGISDVKLLRYQWRIISPIAIDVNSRWETKKQKWNVQEGDI